MLKKYYNKKPTLSDVYSFFDLEYSSLPSSDFIKKAKKIEKKCLSFSFKTCTSHGDDGEIMVTAFFKEHYLEFMLDWDNTITFVYEKNRKEIDYEEDLSFEDALRKLKYYGKKIWMQNTLESLEMTDMIFPKKDLKAPLLKFPVAVEFQLFPKIALWLQDLKYVNTSESSQNPHYMENPQSIGNLPWKSYLLNATSNLYQ